MPADKSVLLIGNFLYEHGASRPVSQDLALRLAERGWDVTVSSDKVNKLMRLGRMVVDSVVSRGRYSVAHVDVYSGQAFLWAEATCAVLKRLGRPFVLTLHGGNLPNFARRWPRRVSRLLRSAKLVTTPSRYLLEEMRPYRADLVLLPNAVEVSAYDFRRRDSFGLRLVWLRAFHQVYNPQLAPRVLSALTARYPGASLVMYGPDRGDGSLQETQKLARSLGLEGRVEFAGKIDKSQVAERLNEADIFLNTPSIDNTPVSVIEAMACGLPVVSTNVGGIPHLIEDGVSGLLVAPDDPAAMAAAVIKLHHDPELASRVALNARRQVEQFDWSVVLPRWEGLLLSCVEKAGGSAREVSVRT